jgi:enoyl-CoA hydratase/carnithine racemase
MLKKEIQDGIVIARLTDGKTNAITLETLKQLKKIVTEVNENDDLKGIILSGEGRFFSSGFSLPLFLGFETPEEVVSFFTEQEEILVEFFTCKKPVVSAINGHCAAMGLILAMASDYRIVKNHPKIKLGMSEIKIGLGLSIAQSAVLRFGLDSDKRFRDVMYFGNMVDVTTAKQMELVDETVEEENLIPRAKQIISLWIDTPNRPFIQIKQALKADTAKQIQKTLGEEDWQERMVQTLLSKDVKATLEFVQAGMEAKK